MTLSPVAMNDPPPDYTEKPQRSGDHMLIVTRLSSVEESHEPLSSPPVTMTTTLEASTSHITDTSNQESVTNVTVEVDTNVTNQEAASNVQTGRENITIPPIIVTEEVLTKTTETTNQQAATEVLTNQEITTNQETLTVAAGTTDQEVQSNWEEVTVDVDKSDQLQATITTTKSFTIQATPHRNVILSARKEQEIEAKLTATL